MTHVQTFVDTVLAIAFMEAIVKPVTLRLTKKLLRRADEEVGFIPDYLHSKQEY